ncbi:hypothetical protein V5P93_000681 [Actinokineospora auranticolor]|uniref:Uncharacterized protein n=1 Tax=Actinokineospora auranticolor TaxID=155976 RepID=A0A2S6GZ03_9PSEU|nr:hypothetical protein [Actinokineospora auranticolor]PPK70438.1 hypothetical protein CLV40_102353 [Actinokineospora auranticolor]
MPFSSTEFAAELRRLRRGRGVQGPRIGDEVGPALRALCAITPHDSHAAIREKLGARIAHLGAALPHDLRIAVGTALALDPGSSAKFLNDRMRALADRFDRDVRTVRRRIDEALDLLAEHAALHQAPDLAQPTGPAAPRPGTGPWRVERLEAVVRLDAGAPECIERRTIVAERDLGDRIVVPVSPRSVDPGSTAPVRSYFGAELLDTVPRADGGCLLELRLPTPLTAGQRHEYGLVVDMPRAAPPPHYMYLPEQRCDSFDLRVRFPQAPVPTAVSLVRGARDLDSTDTEDAEATTVDAVREVHARFDNLTSGLAYGLRWRYANLSA